MHHSDDLRHQLLELTQENLALREENSRLLNKVETLEKHSTLAKGIAGESLIVSFLDGIFTSKNASHDISSERNGIHIEFKHSNLNLAADHYTTQRWAWSKIFGEPGKKDYDRLILIGDSDLRWRARYLEPESPYVIFDIPLEEAMPLTTQIGRHRSIQLSTNPKKARSPAAPMYARHQVTLAQLEARYNI